jgi:hypothetical protein
MIHSYFLLIISNFQVWRQRRGKVLGGTGSANGMNYAKGNRKDYDRWEKEGCTGWGYKDVFPYFKKMESVNIPEYQNSCKFYYACSASVSVMLRHRIPDGLCYDGWRAT